MSYSDLPAVLAILHIAANFHILQPVAGEVFQNQDTNATSRDSRNLRLMGSCQTTDGYKGQCMTNLRCRQMNGVATKFCGAYGVCCEINLQCSQTSKLKVTSIKTPAQIPQECEYIIKPFSQDVCQIRIDFRKFDLAQPTLMTIPTTGGTAYTCTNYFNVDNIVLCGNNDGQHIYLPFNVTAGMEHLRLLFVTGNRQLLSNWRLIVTQLACPGKRQRSLSNFMPFGQQSNLFNMRTLFGGGGGSGGGSQGNNDDDYDLLAPIGCLQYYAAPTGTVQSFNYNNGMGMYMTSMSYAICFKRQVRNSLIEFTSEFFILPNQGMNGGFDSDCHGTVVTAGKQRDYLMIPGAFMNTMPSDFQPTYFCGTSLNGQKRVYTAMDGPFVIYFLSDETSFVGQDVGFRLRYQIK